MHLSKLRNWFLASPPIEYAISKLRDLLVGAIKQGPVPQHIAFIMDGNRRFARTHGIETVEGHNLGFEALARILEVCYRSGVQVVTIYAFSIENFKRSKFEVDALMEMARVKLSQMAQHGEILDRYGAKVRVLGRLDLLRPDVLAAVDRAVDMTKNNGDRVLNICFPYTSRDEITSAIRDTVSEYSKPLRSTHSSSSLPRTPFSEDHITQNIRSRTTNGKLEDSSNESDSVSESSTLGEDDGQKPPDRNHVYKSESALSSAATLHLPDQPTKGQTRESTGSEPPVFKSPETITRQTLADHLLTRDNPPLDLLIRTSGVERLSDFMLWQCHENTEIAFLDILWPEFDLWQFLPVLLRWQRRVSKARQNPDAEGNFDGEFQDPSDDSREELVVSSAAKPKSL
ncbi:undecaprenyl diphosphate synthase family protein [Aspergillus mulundensis]|uniref:Alkyl transferase n=1 Tax=Aspergillus mulundensis TaxID=1810919 RepID=A0A3D8QFM1_9EURO|nr:Ditrans,polycis-polyprenyl diphosphate synthase ((2E,6E)-farnesyl diphosphate specific) [Aspergillus mulundensis]RDW60511.1 Ditrans,polycis-polyprenyl diphosphate synthase ((2E,6E)-farnesyl diphosphate specific) [Aspergillus mulundensis]